MVCLPYGPHRLLHQAANARAALRAAGGQIPEPGAEVGPGQHGVSRQADNENREREVGQHQGSTSISGAPGAASISGGVRARRLSMKRTTEASPMYTITRVA